MLGNQPAAVKREIQRLGHPTATAASCRCRSACQTKPATLLTVTAPSDSLCSTMQWRHMYRNYMVRHFWSARPSQNVGLRKDAVLCAVGGSDDDCEPQRTFHSADRSPSWRQYPHAIQANGMINICATDCGKIGMRDKRRCVVEQHGVRGWEWSPHRTQCVRLL